LKKWSGWRSEYASNKYDVIIIGSGISGLTSGILLAKEGKKVLILEKHFKAGGWTHTFKRDNYEWDVGIHYIGEVHNPNSPVRKLFDLVSDGKLEWHKMVCENYLIWLVMVNWNGIKWGIIMTVSFFPISSTIL